MNYQRRVAYVLVLLLFVLPAVLFGAIFGTRYVECRWGAGNPMELRDAVMNMVEEGAVVSQGGCELPSATSVSWFFPEDDLKNPFDSMSKTLGCKTPSPESSPEIYCNSGLVTYAVRRLPPDRIEVYLVGEGSS